MPKLMDGYKSLENTFNLSGKIALVTGGSRGLGLSIAEALGEYGAKTILVSRSKTDLDEAVAHLHSLGFDADAEPANLGAPNAAQTLVETVRAQHGEIDILVNNAGTSWGCPAEDYPMEGWDKVMNLNVKGMFFLTQAVAKACFIPRGGGKVINIASIEGLGGHHPEIIGTVAYNAAKGAVVNMTRALAAEWGSRNINVNAIAPGYFPSKLTESTIKTNGDLLHHLIPLNRLGGRNDLKGPALVLASEAGRHMTGQIIVVDGGQTAI